MIEEKGGAVEATTAPREGIKTTTSPSLIPSQPNRRQRSAADLVGDGIIISKFWKNRTRNEAVFVSLRKFKGHTLIDMRVFVGGWRCDYCANAVDRHCLLLT